MTDERIVSYNGELEIYYDTIKKESKLLSPFEAEGITFRAAVEPFDANPPGDLVDIRILVQASPSHRQDFTSDGWFAFAHIDSQLVSSRFDVTYTKKIYKELFYEWQGFLSSTIAIKHRIAASDLLTESGVYVNNNKLNIKIVIRHVVSFRVLPACSRRLEPLRPKRYAEDFFRSLFNKKDFSDGSFVIADLTIPIHTILLIARNIDVFGPMFQSNEFLETKKVNLTHLAFSKSALQSVLRWIYRCELVIDSASHQRLAPQIYKIAKTWNILPLIHTCYIFVQEKNVWTFLNLSRVLQDNRLRDICFALIAKLGNKSLDATAFVKHMELEDIKLLLLSNAIQFTCYNIIFAILKWTEARKSTIGCNGNCQEFLKPLLDQLKREDLNEDELKELRSYASKKSLKIDFFQSSA